MTQRTETEWDWGAVRAQCLEEARRLLGSSAAADDAAQEAAIRAWRKRAHCRTPARPQPWIAQIARREALRVLARRHELPLSDDVSIADPRQEFSGFVDSLDLWRAMSGIKGQDRRLLIGRYWQDLPPSELATQLGLAEVTVRVRLHRIRQRLRDKMMEI
jgi:RNA polymerase sigma-70 factor (ECF subfamily)